MEHRMILVTGAAGLSGTAIVRELSRQRFGVRALVRNRAKAESLALLPGVDLIEGDMARGETLGAALHGIERVLMIIAAIRSGMNTNSISPSRISTTAARKPKARRPTASSSASIEPC
jgi:uncharacterized protein YbjT (DUF2867 family)